MSVVRRARRVSENQNAVLQIEHSTLAGLASLVGCRDYVLDMHDLAFPSPVYGDLPLGSGVQRGIKALEARGLRDASEVVVVSDQMKSLIAETWDISTDRFSTVPNGYFSDIRDAYMSSDSVRGRVAFLGSLHPKLSVQTFEEICRLSEVTELVVVGDGPMRSEFESIDEAELRLTGYLPDDQAFELIAGAQVAINPQRVSRLQRASSPVKLYYYTGLGLPMVLTEGPDEVRMLADRDAATSVPEDGDFSEAVRQVLVDDDRRESMRAALNDLGWEFTWEERVKRLVKLYDDLGS
jgi:glycosyltransferase involved in cell wall biosynthesis